MSVALTTPRVARSEWLKLRTLRSTWWTVLAAVVMIVGFSVLVCAISNAQWDHFDEHDRETFDPTGTSLAGVLLGQVALAVLGVLTVTGEYSTGMIRSTFAAVPRRLPVVWAKAAVYGVFAFVTSLVACLAAFLVGQALLTSHGVDLGDPGTVRGVTGSAAYIALLGLVGMGLGLITRSTAGSLAGLIGLLVVAPILLASLPGSWPDHVSKYLLFEAGDAVFDSMPGDDVLSPGAGLAVLVLWALAVLVPGAWLAKRRDA